MLGEELSQALSDISDDKIEAAAGIVPQSRKQIWLRVVAAAAVLALVMTLLLWPGEPEKPQNIPNDIVLERGVLRVYACEMRSNDETQIEQYELTDGVMSQTPYWSPYVNALCHGIPLQFRVPEGYFGEREITIDLSTGFGRFFQYNDKRNGKSCVSISEDTIIFWDGYSQDGEWTELADGTTFYMDMVIKANGEIVGYGVIKAECSKQEGYPFMYALKECTTVCFPLVGGHVQQVSEEFIQEQISKCK